MKSISNQFTGYVRSSARSFLPKQDTAAVTLDMLSGVPWLVDWYTRKYIGTFVISFPKCGRTWLRLMIGRVLQNHFALEHPDILNLIAQLDEQLTKLDSRVPRIRFKHDDDPYLKTPEQLVRSKHSYRYANAIFLVRDPRDVIVSAYFYYKNRPYERDISDLDISTYLRSHVGSFETLLAYYNIWAENVDAPKAFLIVRYEDLHQNPVLEMRRILSLIGLDEVEEKNIAEAVAFSSFDNMRKMEENTTFEKYMRGFDPGQQDSYFVRQGQVGSFRQHLSEADVDYLNQTMAELLSPQSLALYGYQ